MNWQNWARIYTDANKAAGERAVAYVCAAKLGLESADEKAKRGPDCFVCYYLSGSRIAGQAFTDWTCRVCGAEGTASSTDTPYYCKTCCAKHKLCPTCGAKAGR